MILIDDNTIIFQYCRAIQEGHYGVTLELPMKLEEHFWSVLLVEDLDVPSTIHQEFIQG